MQSSNLQQNPIIHLIKEDGLINENYLNSWLYLEGINSSLLSLNNSTHRLDFYNGVSSQILGTCKFGSSSVSTPKYHCQNNSAGFFCHQ